MPRPPSRSSRYVHGPGADEPVAQYDGPALGLANRKYMLPDERGSIAALVNADGSPSVVNRYDPWGYPGAGNGGRFQYTGQTWIPELGLYHYKARLYSPALGRFLQIDPIGYEGGINLYAYAANDPLNRTDPTGKQESLAACVAGPVPCVAGIVITIVKGAALLYLGSKLTSDTPTSTTRTDEERSSEGREVITQGKKPDGMQIDNRDEDRGVKDVLEEAANVAGVEVGQTKDGKPTVRFPDGTRATGYPESRTTRGPSIVISGPEGHPRVKTRENNY